MDNYFLSPNKETKQWNLQAESSKEILITEASKKEALSKSIAYIKKTATMQKPISLKIQKRNGEIQEEKTYPKSEDPKKSKG